MKFISWNVNGIRACLKKGFEEYFQEANADIFCIQERFFSFPSFYTSRFSCVLFLILIYPAQKTFSS